jgi:uncharacterized membrane protein YhaH (DUF805 family)
METQEIDQVIVKENCSEEIIAPRKFSLKNLFKGRMGRRQYFWSFMLSVILFGVFVVVYILPSGYFKSNTPWLFIGAPIFVLVFLFSTSVTVRRLHDIGLPGWLLIPLYFIKYNPEFSWISFN